LMQINMLAGCTEMNGRPFAAVRDAG
jgi:hypothetical protein